MKLQIAADGNTGTYLLEYELGVGLINGDKEKLMKGSSPIYSQQSATHFNDRIEDSGKRRLAYYNYEGDCTLIMYKDLLINYISSSKRSSYLLPLLSNKEYNYENYIIKVPGEPDLNDVQFYIMVIDGVDYSFNVVNYDDDDDDVKFFLKKRNIHKGRNIISCDISQYASMFAVIKGDKHELLMFSGYDNITQDRSDGTYNHYAGKSKLIATFHYFDSLHEVQYKPIPTKNGYRYLIVGDSDYNQESIDKISSTSYIFNDVKYCITLILLKSGMLLFMRSRIVDDDDITHFLSYIDRYKDISRIIDKDRSESLFSFCAYSGTTLHEYEINKGKIKLLKTNELNYSNCRLAR